MLAAYRPCRETESTETLWLMSERAEEVATSTVMLILLELA